ncbi:MAG: hypothetical protein DHS20C17_25850 [Cyclobacteriaceae bacterium]|nr:MAG: hypothetical protein DHS20C17_25850 [Cyclobacteriaceae bacterium]
MGCVDDDNSEGIAVREKRLAEISAEVEAVIANKSCNGADDCASIAWGSKPCGGPWGYLVYAPSNVEVSRLESLVAEYNSLESELNQLRGSASDCALVEQPELECTDNVCVAM